MPVPLRVTHHRPDAKYNVTTDFPSLGLHSAASTGNVGLVEYALSRGQPVNSVVDGVLPLHAACAGGNVQVVKLLIEYGADVNAPRLPKRYSSRDSSAPIIGTTGSTPLHFAAANGNRDAIMLLLLHGAHANRPDKHGVTPESLARQNGWIECADVLKDWILNKDRDLREREEFVAIDGKDQGKRRNRIGSFGDPEPSSIHRRRIHVKHSIDTALNMLKSSSSNLADTYHRSGHHTPTPPTSPNRAYGDFSQQQILSQGGEHATDSGPRRPSLPYVKQPDSLPRPRKESAQSANLHRPRSAGSGAEESERVVPSYGKGGAARKLGSKVSLLNLFRKGQNSDPANAPETNVNAAVSDAVSLSTSPPNGGLPIPGSSLTHRSSHSRFHQDADPSIRSRTIGDPSLERKPSLNSPSRSPLPLALDLHNALAQEQQRINNRDRSRSNASSRYEYLNDELATSGVGSYQSPGSSPLARIGLLRNQGHNRDRSDSGSSLGYEINATSRLGTDDLPNGTKGSSNTDADILSRSLPRPGILKNHNRSGSNGQGHMAPFALRAFSRDAVSHSPSPRGTPARLKSSNSVGSLVRSDSYTRSGLREDQRRGSGESESGPKPADHSDDDGDDGDRDTPIEEEKDEEYGNPIEGSEARFLLSAIGKQGASSRASLSPIISNDHTSGEGEDALAAADFPFSINLPPPMLPDEVAVPTPTSISKNLVVTDTRQRGDSLSSDGTSDSQEHSHSSSVTSAAMLSTPLLSTEIPPPTDRKEGVLAPVTDMAETDDNGPGSQYVIISPATDASFSPPPQRPFPLPLQPIPQTLMHSRSSSNLTPSHVSSGSGSLSGRRTHTPFGIDISSISTHAQAEALVEKARREVMELANLEEQDLVSNSGSDGRTPLSARLAAYGESLALERRFRELEKGAGSAASRISTNGDRSAVSTGASSTNLLLSVNQHSRDGSGYGPPLHSGKSTGGLRDATPSRLAMDNMRNGHMKRPSTAEGLAPRDINVSLSSEQSEQSYQTSRSTSALGHRRSPYHQHQFSQLQEQIPTLNVSPSNDVDDDSYITSGSMRRYIARSRTPTGDYENEMKTGMSISRMASLDGMEFDNDDFGSPLYRVSTAPSPARLPPAQAQGRSAKKLSKMGISVADQAGRGALPSALAAQSGKRFGAFRSLFKGKS